ncbi:MAG TPA: phosphoribosylanthranilate isomerase [Gemmatimonadaceae bacterium]|nr:phosphoribosylanthranilate isomerase [Gemmatimonadaceae bacterium]
MTPEIKFCGMTRAGDVSVASSLGASYVGVIFAGGPRHQTPDGASRVFAGTAPPPKRVGVVGEQTAQEIAELVEALQLDVVQLHANPEPRRLEAVRAATNASVWAVLRIADGALPPHADALASSAHAIVLDAHTAGGLGGSGVTLPWAKLAPALEAVRRESLLVLAGGLRPDNVAAAIAALYPDVVDVSSGVESAPGIKDHVRMRAFRDAVAGAGVKK